ncbi:Vta1 like-domain-containing protein [Suillus fuscotomentosus]|uniref:Vta1 like-domain-containing protein n=1 Tax=Suillus fuscotomentosus TaxID=1912939 RepID=A0AAD4EEQ4_9AGAM|nr:Vta1 like-domain-containing protein [Suillus fuscotomentosus]KAG1904696.1 Vta1 like-domain-containing protein [Suillus fuscotomentosus]
MSLGLPPVSAGLKSIAPYLQRAEELVNQQPVVAYWCAYYAAQLGINLKAKDAASRTLLLNLLNALERLKTEIGPSDTIDSEPASAAFVENFALKIFRIADDEDREGHATRSTAKKFLAAANFFEVLKVFPTTDISDTIDGKIKYAKWKAADIAKAYREGRKPTPGPAGSQFDLEPLPATSGASELPSRVEDPQTSSSATSQSPTLPQTSHYRQTPSPRMSPDDITRANRLHSPRHDDESLSPGCWSTTATPGFDLAQDNSSVSLDQANNWHETPLNGRGSQLRKAWISTDVEGTTSDEELVRDPLLNGSSPSQVPFLPFASESRPSVFESSSPPKERPVIYAPTTRDHVSPTPPHPSFLPSISPPRGSPPRTRVRGPSISSQELPLGFVPSSPVPPPMIPPPPMPTIFAPSSPPRMVPPPPVPAPLPLNNFQLTPTIIAKAQKHCRFAISSLDYEDAEQARKELRAALALLGG